MSQASKLRWRCRRGTKELDVMLERFLDRHYPDLDEAGQAAFERLLEEEDDRLIDWLLSDRERPTDGPLADIVARIRAAV